MTADLHLNESLWFNSIRAFPPHGSRLADALSLSFSLSAVTHFSSVLLCDYVLTKEQREQEKKEKQQQQKNRAICLSRDKEINVKTGRMNLDRNDGVEEGGDRNGRRAWTPVPRRGKKE